MNEQATDTAPTRIPLATSLQNRYEEASIDARIINGWVEQVAQDQTWVYTRPGLSVAVDNSSAASGLPALGVFNWQGDIYSVWGTKLFKGTTQIGTVDDSSGYTFSSILGSTPQLFLHNLTNGYYYDSTGGLQTISGSSWPTTMVPGQAYLDGTSYVMTDKALIQGSNINDLSTWPSLNNLFAQIEPDQGVALAKQLVYVVAFKQWSTEMFYDAGNSTGSPLGAVQGQKLNFGCRHPGSVAELSGMLLWASSTRNGGVNVMLMDQLTAKAVSTPQVDRLLQGADFSGPVYSWTARLDGHLLYTLTIQNSNLTLVYDVSQKVWYEWADVDGNFFPIYSATFLDGDKPLLQHLNNGYIYQLDLSVATDNGSRFTVDIYTPPFYGGTRRRKMMSALNIIGDKQPGSILQIRKSDDDFATWSNFREVDMGLNNPRLTGEGTFRRRVYHLRMASGIRQRIMALEPELELGDL